MFVSEGLVSMQQIHLSEAIAQKASLSLLNPTSVAGQSPHAIDK
jgi:dCMP deaminase